ncbi:MAG TPA: hypothetical protein P5081_02470 [Phycisphaerae bacterium]|nr:hypothetical protein [Phycisphaerae bacterium]HRW51721.1 hypothetical protein [Phycisphaerae bacterium]
MKFDGEWYSKTYNDVFLDDLIEQARYGFEIDAWDEVCFFIADGAYSPTVNPEVQREFLARIERKYQWGPEVTQEERATLAKWQDEGANFVTQAITRFEKYSPISEIQRWMNDRQTWEFATLTTDRSVLRRELAWRHRGQSTAWYYIQYPRYNALMIHFSLYMDRCFGVSWAP